MLVDGECVVCVENVDTQPGMEISEARAADARDITKFPSNRSNRVPYTNDSNLGRLRILQEPFFLLRKLAYRAIVPHFLQ